LSQLQTGRKQANQKSWKNFYTQSNKVLDCCILRQLAEVLRVANQRSSDRTKRSGYW
jgi:hypothetical protein